MLPEKTVPPPGSDPFLGKALPDCSNSLPYRDGRLRAVAP